MEEQPIIQVNHVSMRFNLSREKVDSIKTYVVMLLKHQLMFDEFYALRDVSFTVNKGEPFAIIGENGCGKSTLLKVISGIFAPSSGSVKVDGTIAPLIELGAGFDIDLTARENIYLNGAVLGYDTAFMDSKFQEIMDFAELWDFVDVPVKNFSSGMVARLGFAIATVVVPDVLIVDEILAVGDFMFQQKCEQKMKEMIEQGATLIFVSHSSDQVKRLCKKAIWLKHGVTQMIGDAQEVCDAYIHDMETGGHGLVQQPPQEPEDAPPQDSPPPVSPKKRFPVLDLLRALALFMVVWDHLGPFRNPDWWLGRLVENNVNQPLGITQSFGAFGVVLFFLISGYLLPLERGGRLSFAGKKLLKLYPPLLISFASFWLVQKVVGLMTGPTFWASFSPRQWMLGATLLNYPLGEPDVINGTTWFLFPTLLFYFLGWLFLPWFQKKPKLAAAGCLLVLGGGLWAAVSLPLPSVLVNVLSFGWYVSFPLFGALVYWLREKKMGFGWFLVFSGINYLLTLKGMVHFKPDYYSQSPYLISFAYAFLLFALGLALESQLPSLPLVGGISRVSYSVYLTHMTYGGLLMTLLTPFLGYTGAFVVTLALVAFVALAHYRLVERPVGRLTKQLFPNP